MNLDAFTRAYLTCALWSSTDNSNEQGGDPLDQHYDISDVDPETMLKAIADCAVFQAVYAIDLSKAGSPEQNGHDFWLTRNHHGAGFWDRGYDAGVSRRLTNACHACGEVDLYITDDGKVAS